MMDNVVFKDEGMEISSSLKWKHVDKLEKVCQIIGRSSIRGCIAVDGSLVLLGSSLYTYDDYIVY